MRSPTVGVSVLVLLAAVSCGARSGIPGLDGEGDPGLPVASGSGGGASAVGAGGSPSDIGGAGGSVASFVLPCTGSSQKGVVLGGKAQVRVDACTFRTASVIDADHANLTFVSVPGKSTFTLSRVDGPEGCAAVGGEGWYFVPNVPGVIVQAPAVETFQVCPDACSKIPAGVDDWGLKYNTCG